MIMTDQDHDGSHIKERDRGDCENKNSFARHGNFTTGKKEKKDIQQTGIIKSGESKGTPPMPPPPGNKALLRDY